MTLVSLIQQISDITKSADEKQKEISVSEVWHLDGHLQMRYDVLETTKILKNYAQSTDLQIILNLGIKTLQSQVEVLEKLMDSYMIPLSPRPPFDDKSTANIEFFTDRFIFRKIFQGIQSFIPIHATAFTQSTNPAIREYFKGFLFEEIKLYDKFIEYGKIKGFEDIPPQYRI